MTDETQSPAATDDRLPITDPYRVAITFVNQVVGAGHLNGVVNVTFAAALFTPAKNGIEPDLVITSRLRMDMFCAEQLYAQLGQIIEKNIKRESVN